MDIRNKQVPAAVRMLLFILLLPLLAFASTFQHYIQQIRRTDGQVMAGAQVRIYLPGTNTPATVYSNITGTVVKSQPILTDSTGYFDFYLGDQVVDILMQGSNFPTTKLLNVTLSALATAGVLTVPNGGTGNNSFTLNTVLLGNGTLPIKTSSVGLANQVLRVPAAGGQPDFGAVNLSNSAAVTGVLPPANGGTGSTNGSVLRVREQDGTPNVPNVVEVKVSNGTMTDDGGGVVSISTGGGTSGWTDDGAVVRLTTASDLVGVGTAAPTSKFHALTDGSSASGNNLVMESTGGFGPGIALVSTGGSGRTFGWVSTNGSNCFTAGDMVAVDVTSSTCSYRLTLKGGTGNFGVTDTNPAELFTVGTNGPFRVNSTGNLVRVRDIPYSWPAVQGGATTFLRNDGAGNLTWAAGTGSTAPGGADKNVQFNDAGSFGGDAFFNWDKVAKFLSVGSQTSALNDEGFIVTNQASHNGVIASMRVGDGDPPGNSPGFRTYKARNTFASPTAVTNNDWLLGISMNAYDGSNFVGQARIYNVATENWSTTARGNKWIFSTTSNGTTTISDRLTITHNGILAGLGLAGTHGIGNANFSSLGNIDYGSSSEFFGYRANGTEAASTSLGSGEDIHRYLIQGKCGSTEQCNGAEIRFSTAEAWSSTTNVGTHIRFFTAKSNDTGVVEERVVIRDTGQIRIQEGSNRMMGTANLAGGTAVVNNTMVTANSRIFLTSQVDGGTPGFLRVSARTAATSFTITSSSGTDTSTVAWIIFDPTP